MVDAGVCSGEKNCIERIAPSYHSRAPAPGRRAMTRDDHTLRMAAVDLHLIDLGSPLAGRRD
ncbi:MAG: hypothetical protein SA339_13300 [Methanomassiliicoccus sp.]|nr:hypothetical protein [Methanomassiliicoccus sp.]